MNICFEDSNKKITNSLLLDNWTGYVIKAKSTATAGQGNNSARQRSEYTRKKRRSIMVFSGFMCLLSCYIPNMKGTPLGIGFYHHQVVEQTGLTTCDMIFWHATTKALCARICGNPCTPTLHCTRCSAL